MYTLDDTIVAISTPLGYGGIGIVRLSGPEALGIARQLFRPAGRAWERGIESHRLYYGHIVDPQTNRVVDEVLLSYMRAPHTYTRQDVVEINAHGGIVPLREILALCLRMGARPAREGEFTLRAFLNGRIDLAQAEAVLDVISAKTEAALRVAIAQLSGRLSQRVRQVRSLLLKVLAYLEATIDFPEEDIPPQDISPDLLQAAQQLEELLQESDRGLIYRQGVRTAIVGRPNVGKSSLLNVLLRAERAIVTPIPGTTRDTLEETINLQGIPFVLVDTAGIIDETEDIIERLGIERSRRSLEQADLALVVFDGSEKPSEADHQVATLVGDRPAVVVVNKSDLPQASDYANLLPGAPHISVSALTGEGIPKLEELLIQVVLSGQVVTSEAPLASNPRHRALFQRALEHVREALHALEEGLPLDLVSIDVTEAIDALGELTGETASEELLETIFSNFCIGK
ncbi:MAG: tRNA uridine-5-carboxymethylaminomethyl(34) synthesis GTPase MnmE [Anaerolineae bacterium]|nr:tRNA uridine-5-carboxymethylaminomethyl(34) synthesis GTPase MnmE [Anaerolineae bacterium]